MNRTLGSFWRVCRASLLAALALPGVVACNDATHDEKVAALGPEDPGVSKGPLHRPGQPCLVCHGGIGPASAQFVIGGTVYTARTSKTPATGAVVQIEDITGSVATATANEAGNFFIPAGQWSPTYPTLPTVTLGGNTQLMSTHVGKEGSCGACHSDPASPVSAGHIYLMY